MRVLGIGNALVDILVSLPDDDFLIQQNLPRGSMQLVDKETSDRILRAASSFPHSIASGGSAANTINGLARLGVETGFIGILGKDDLGKHFIKDFEHNQVISHIYFSETQSGKAIAFVSPDGERTFATHLGAAVELNPYHLDEELLSYYNILHIEGYLLQNYDLIEQAVYKAMRQGIIISLDLASYNVVEQNIDFLKKLIPGKIDILFANEEEAFALTGLHDKEALYVMGEMVPLSVLKRGAQGSMIFDRKQIMMIDALPSECIDTTGAGDLYASGFLYGMILGEPLSECGRFGSVLAGHVIREIGAKINDDNWKNIYKLLYGIDI